APLGTAARGTDGFVIDGDEYRVGVGIGIEAEGDPTAALDGNFERNLLQRAIREDVFLGDGIGVDDGFNRNGLTVEARGNFRGEADGRWLVELDFAAARTNRDDLWRGASGSGDELHQVAGAVTDVGAAVANPFAPLFIHELAGGLHIHAAHADALA